MPGLLDLSVVTDRLLDVLRVARTNTRLWIEEPNPPLGASPIGTNVPPGDLTPNTPFDILFTGMSPDQARTTAGACRVSLYLFHVAPEQFHANTYPSDPRLADGSPERRYDTRARRIPQQPLALTLYYLLSAHSLSYVEEQQAMSISLKALHDHPSVKIAIPAHAPGDPTEQSISVVLHPQSVDDISRLWQAISTPLRMATVYRVSVVFLEPELPTKPAPKPVATVNAPASPPPSAYPQFVFSRVEVDGAKVTVTGHHLDDPTIVVRLDTTTLAIDRVPAAPVPTGIVGHAQIVGAHTAILKLPNGTRAGHRLRLTVALAGETYESTVSINPTVDIP